LGWPDALENVSKLILSAAIICLGLGMLFAKKEMLCEFHSFKYEIINQLNEIRLELKELKEQIRHEGLT
jgi:hypothetical protein